jgi:hypothetical protein
MNKVALHKHEIYKKLSGMEARDLGSIIDYIDYMRNKSNQKSSKIIKLRGILKGHKIEPEDIKKLRHESLRHLEQELTIE